MRVTSVLKPTRNRHDLAQINAASFQVLAKIRLAVGEVSRREVRGVPVDPDLAGEAGEGIEGKKAHLTPKLKNALMVLGRMNLVERPNSKNVLHCVEGVSKRASLIDAKFQIISFDKLRTHKLRGFVNNGVFLAGLDAKKSSTSFAHREQRGLEGCLEICQYVTLRKSYSAVLP